MAAGILSKPGTKHGPCEGDCKHTDCAATRTLAGTVCPFCKEPIGYGRRFYGIDEEDVAGEFAHETCYLDYLEID